MKLDIFVEQKFLNCNNFCRQHICQLLRVLLTLSNPSPKHDCNHFDYGWWSSLPSKMGLEHNRMICCCYKSKVVDVFPHETLKEKVSVVFLSLPYGSIIIPLMTGWLRELKMKRLYGKCRKSFNHNKLWPETAFTNIAMFSLFYLLKLCLGRRRLHLPKVDFRRRIVPTLDQASCVGGTTHSWST